MDIDEQQEGLFLQDMASFGNEDSGDVEGMNEGRNTEAFIKDEFSKAQFMETDLGKYESEQFGTGEGEETHVKTEEAEINVKSEHLSNNNSNEFYVQSSEDVDASVVKAEVEENGNTKSTEDSPGAKENQDGRTRRSSSPGEEPTPKKPCLEINIRKLLPDLEKHWKTVEEDPNDFTAWTYLLQYVDQENELLAAREAYDAFLSRYPYCYGYWKKYADYEKRRGSSSDCEQVFRRGLKAVSLSVDLWIHYLNYVKATHEKEPEYIRAQFDAAIAACGMEFRSDKLWDHYIHWEKENNELRNVLAIYDKVISMPTQSHAAHFQHVNEFINQSVPSEILTEEELQSIVEEDRKGDTEENGDMIDDARLREIILAKRSAAYKKNEAEISARWAFEEAIKRPYFHVKPLEKGQLKIWKEYLDFEIEKGIHKRIIVLFERCLIACALYEEYWIKYAKFLQIQPVVDVPKLREVFTKASTILGQKKPWINLHWASFEEAQGNHTEVVSILDKLETQFPDSLHIQYRKINFERRVGHFEKCKELFQKYIRSAKNKSTTAHIVVKYARFLSEVMNDYEGAKKLLLETTDMEESSRGKAIMALVDIGMQRNPTDVELVVATFDEALQQSISNEQKLTFAHRKIEFLEDYSPDIVRIEKAQAELQSIVKILREQKPTEEAGRQGEEASKRRNSTAYQENNQQQTAFGQQYNQYGPGQYSNWNSGQSGGGGYSNNSQQGWSAYQGYYA